MEVRFLDSGRGSAGEWVSRRLGDDPIAFGRAPGGGLVWGREVSEPIGAILPQRSTRSAVLLLAPGERSVLIDGCPALGVSVLEDRCELIVDGESVHYQAYGAPEITRLADGDVATCVTCQRRLEVGDSILRCARCNAARHEGPRAGDLPALHCVTYSNPCPRCGEEVDPQILAEGERQDG